LKNKILSNNKSTIIANCPLLERTALDLGSVYVKLYAVMLFLFGNVFRKEFYKEFQIISIPFAQ
jgi:hypothetical protein